MIDSKKRILDFIENFKFIDKTIKISEAISVNKDNFNRHFTSFSNFEFTVESVGVRFSGAKIYFSSQNLNYEIHFDLISEFTETEKNEYQIIEILSENVYRKTILVFI